MEKEELIKQIREAISEVSEKKIGLHTKSISTYNPEKVANILYLFAIGNTQTRIIRKYKYDRNSVVSVLVDYADYFGKFKEMAGQIAAKNYLQLSSLEEDLVEEVRGKMERGELDVTFRDLKELSIAKANAGREALTARGEATQITEDRKVYTQQDYEDTLSAAKARLKKIKGEVIDIDDN